MTELAPAVTESFAMITDAIDHNGTCLVEIVPIKAHLIEGVKLRSPS